MFSLTKLGAVAGVAAIIVAFVCISVAISSYPQFSWTQNALSDLGVVEGTTMAIFNIGLATSGVLGVVFAAGIFRYFNESVAGRVGAVVFAASCSALFCIGVFNEHYSPTHYVVSVLFFALAPIAFFILTGAFYLSRHRKLAALSIILGAIAASTWILQFTIQYVSNVAIPEAVSAAAISVWAIAVATEIPKTAD
jgi:hypothetical membrane protein